MNYFLVLLMIAITPSTYSSIRALNIAATGMVAQEENVSNISNKKNGNVY